MIQMPGYEKNERRRLFALGCLLGAAVFFLLYGLSPLDVTNDAWLRGGYIEADIQQHYAGWMFYRKSEFSIPFCFSDRINWPFGLSVAFTDSIPLFAALFRLLEPFLPSVFQYFGLFTLLCFVLQGGFACLLVGLFSRRTPIVLLGAVPFVFSPVLLERAFRHTALAAQFLILAALYYYIRGRREGRFFYPGLFAVNCLTLAIHPYFAPMTYALTFALFAEHAVFHQQFVKPAALLAANLGCTALVGWLFGLFSGGSASGGSGVQYGHFCMNLNALWNPVSRGMGKWSLFLPAQNQTLGNYDGFNYLGLGMLLCSVAVVIVVLRWHRFSILKCLKNRFGLLFVVLCLTVFAVSNVITANGAVLALIPLPQFVIQLATTLRSSGRLFWPVYYLIFTCCVAALIRLTRYQKQWVQTAVIGVLCLVQLVDLSPALLEKAGSFRPYSDARFNLLSQQDSSLAALLDATEGRYQHLVALGPLKTTGLSLALYTADEKMTSSDTSFTARYDEAQAQRRQEEFVQAITEGAMPQDCIFFTEQEETFLAVAQAAQDQGAWCGVLYQQTGDETRSPLVYVIAPGLEEFTHPLAMEFSENYPLHLADYSDDFWDHGILSLNLESIGRQEDANRVVLFYDTPFTRQKLEGATALSDGEGGVYPILEVSDQDAGWLMVTLEIDDAHCLYNESGQCKDLEVLS